MKYEALILAVFFDCLALLAAVFGYTFMWPVPHDLPTWWGRYIAVSCIAVAASLASLRLHSRKPRSRTGYFLSIGALGVAVMCLALNLYAPVAERHFEERQSAEIRAHLDAMRLETEKETGAH